jgi:hypothetical protein
MLKDIYPVVEHIGRFNLKSDLAVELLDTADEHAAKVAIPYALATHEGFVMSMLALAKEDNKVSSTKIKKLTSADMHEILFEAFGEVPNPIWLDLFHLTRLVRNCLTHSADKSSANLQTKIANLSPEAESEWTRITRGRPPSELIGKNGSQKLTAEDYFAAFAITKKLGRDVNKLLSQGLSPQTWADLAIVDYSERSTKTKNSSGWRRAALGYARKVYPGTGITDANLEQAAREKELWSKETW